MMPEPELALIKSPSQALAVYSSRVSLKRVGREYLASCPLHSEKTASFKLFERDGSLLFKCFGCNKSGNAVQFIQALDSCSFGEAAQRVKNILNWEEGRSHVEKVFRPIVSTSEPRITFPLDKLSESERNLESNPDARKFLAGRGISLEVAKQFHIGYVQSAAAVNPNHQWVDGGWIIFPTIDAHNTITCLKYRSIRGKKTEDGQPGFLRKSGMATSLFNAQKVNPFDDVFVCEGEFDCLTFAQAGYTSVSLPSAGFSPTPEMRDMLMKSSTIYLAGDSDPVGRAAMEKLWAELRDRTYLIEWPEGYKDANEVFLKACGGVVENFAEMMEHLTTKARSKPMPHFHDMAESLRIADDTKQMDDPKRLHLPWRNADMMAVCRPGSVVSLFATHTGTGKTTAVTQICLNEAIKHGSVVVDYSAELSPQEKSALVASILTRKNRLNLTREDYMNASAMMKDTRYFVGYDPDSPRIQQVIGDDKGDPGLIEWAIRRLGASIVVLDHLHFFTSGEQNSTSVEAAAMTRIKNLAVKYNLIFIVVGQSRKQGQGQKDKASTESDAIGSGMFTRTANTVYHIHREMKRDIDFNDPPDEMLEQQTILRLYKARTKGPGKAAAMLYMDKLGVFNEMVPEGVL